jgi:serine/threonine-protein kinase
VAEELADRELSHVMPILDAGEDANSGSYFVVMPRAARSLQDDIEENDRFTEASAIDVLVQVAEGLAEVPHLVHRDLKPGNVLWWDRRWQIADFGIAKFVEEATSANTVRAFLSPPYAAPEQWLLAETTGATDIYALGCLAYALLTGHPPFAGPESEDYRRQHLEEAPPTIDGISPRLSAALFLMLRKNPETRPSLGRVKELLESRPSGSGALASLAEVGAKLSEEEATKEAMAQAAAEAANKRQRLAQDALAALSALMSDLFARISSAAPTAQVGDHALQLGKSEMRWKVDHELIPEGRFVRSGWDVVAGATIGVNQDVVVDYRGRGASLWFADLHVGLGYRWYEVPYMWGAVVAIRPVDAISPFAVPGIDDADLAASNTISNHQHARAPTPIDDEDFDAFSDRWIEYIAMAATGSLKRPSRLPE